MQQSDKIAKSTNTEDGILYDTEVYKIFSGKFKEANLTHYSGTILSIIKNDLIYLMIDVDIDKIIYSIKILNKYKIDINKDIKMYDIGIVTNILVVCLILLIY